VKREIHLSKCIKYRSEFLFENNFNTILVENMMAKVIKGSQTTESNITYLIANIVCMLI